MGLPRFIIIVQQEAQTLQSSNATEILMRLSISK